MSALHRKTGTVQPSKHIPEDTQIPDKALIMSGFGINSEMETAEVLSRAG